jgi:hypothetical protein
VWSENLAYALTQVIHNFGAVGVVGGAAFALWAASGRQHARVCAWLILAAWSAQIVSGTLFGVISLYYYGETPDLSPVAFVALLVKVAAAAIGATLAALYVSRAERWDALRVTRFFQGLLALGIVALTAAAFLRWFS